MRSHHAFGSALAVALVLGVSGNIPALADEAPFLIAPAEVKLQGDFDQVQLLVAEAKPGRNWDLAH